jgi:hypothetical protein
MIGSWVLGFREAAAMAMPDQGRRRVVVVVALGVVLVVVGLAVPVARGLLGDEPVAPVAPVPVPMGGGPWERLPQAAGQRRAPRSDPAGAVWTGEELILLDPSAFSPPDAARPPEALAYDPDRRSWRVLPAPPLQCQDPGNLCRDGAAYDPHRNRWQRLARSPVPGRASPLTVWTGDRAIFIGGMNVGDRLRLDGGNLPAITEQGAAYRPR